MAVRIQQYSSPATWRIRQSAFESPCGLNKVLEREVTLMPRQVIVGSAASWRHGSLAEFVLIPTKQLYLNAPDETDTL
jgi:hypothetical protein